MTTTNSKSIAYGITRAVIMISLACALLWLIWQIQSVIFYIGIAAVISLIGRPIVLLLRDRLKFSNTLAVIVTMVLILLTIIMLGYMLIPVIIEQGENIGKINLDQVRIDLEILNTQINKFLGIEQVNLIDRIQRLDIIQRLNIDMIPRFINNLFGTLGNLLIGLFSVIFIAFYLLKDSRLLTESVLVFSKKGDEGRFLKAFTKIKQLLSRYFIGLLLQVVILFILYSIILYIVGAHNILTIAFFCALLNLIPYLGPMIGAILMMTYVISDHLGSDFTQIILPDLIIVAIGYMIVQLIDNFINQPLIFGKSVKSHPLEIFIIILIAGLLFGIIGLVLAIPTYTAIKVISKEFLSEYKIVQKLTHNL